MKYTYSGKDMHEASHAKTPTVAKDGVRVVQKRRSTGGLIAIAGALAVAMIVVSVFWLFRSSSSKSENVRSINGSAEDGKVQDACLSPSCAAVRKYGLCVGLDRINPAAYPNVTLAQLNGCCNDAAMFGDMLRQIGYSASVVTNEDATISVVGQRLKEAARQLSSGDVFFMLISGHGGREKARDGKWHETWCLYDGEVWDEQIIAAFSRFKRGVRILLVNDQCYSGGLFLEKQVAVSQHQYWISNVEDKSWAPEKSVTSPDFPQLIQFASSRAEQTSAEYGVNGAWTFALLRSIVEDNGLTLRMWFNQAFQKLERGKQDPQWIEKGWVGDDFRNARFVD